MTAFRGRKVKVSRLIMRRWKMCHIFQMGRPLNFNLGTGMEYDNPHALTSKVKVIKSCHQSDVCLLITWQRRVAEIPKLVRPLFVPRLTFHTSSKVKKSKAQTRLLNDMTENRPYLWSGKAYELQTWYMDVLR